MFYKHTHLLFLPLSLFSNSQILRSNKQTQSQQPCSPPHISPNSPNLKHHRHHHQLPPQRRPWFELVDPGREAWVVLAWVMLAWGIGLGRAGLGHTGLVAQPGRAGLVTQPGRAAQAVVRVYFLIFRFPIQSVFILDFVLVFFENLEV